MLLPRRAIFCLAAVVVATNLAGCADDGAKKPPLEPLRQLVARVAPPERGGAIAFADAPASYRVEYDVYVKGHTSGDAHGGDASLDATHVVRSVVRPFGETGTVRRTLGFVREANSRTSRVTFVRPLPDDPRPQAYPPTTKPRFRRTIAGRVCASYVVDGGEYCVDKQGIVLLTRTANSVEVARKLTVGTRAYSAQQLAQPLARGFVNPDGGSIRPLDPDTAPEGATDYSLPAAPDGFSLVGRYAVVPRTSGTPKRASRQIVAGIVDVYVRGADAVVVERGGKLDTSDVGERDLGPLVNAHPVDLGALGTGQVGIAGNGAFGYREVRATPSQGRYVVVAGTLPEADLVSLAQSLQAWPGNGMRFLDR